MSSYWNGYVTLPSRQVGAVLGDSNVSTCAALGVGVHFMSGGSVYFHVSGLLLWMAGKLGEPLREDTLTFRSRQCSC